MTREKTHDSCHKGTPLSLHRPWASACTRGLNPRNMQKTTGFFFFFFYKNPSMNLVLLGFPASGHRTSPSDALNISYKQQ